ncbi:carboxylesterase family protein [Colletotrichum karsti]|uniref:Carboxylic ester hydrolase n=1 Tax=Colletotrichum karsti TaxID=1095194 RepID=A0A9P6HVQ0_9PEZI|nr:carboxylesterase family protein [Colletotrichum karsti]KAF9871239.1 carboxylesterase family protein [Colletotrichum karsti]
MRDSRIAFKLLPPFVIFVAVVVVWYVEPDTMRSLTVFTALLPFILGAPHLSGGNDAAATFLEDLIAKTRALEGSSETGVCRQTSLTVDLGYAKYEGYTNATTNLNIWKGIRYAAPPTGPLRWQPPQPPSASASNETLAATDFGPICPQNYPAIPGLPFVPGSEDCLYLNVYAPADGGAAAGGLPVMVWIHGGGYGFGDGRQDMAEIINANGNGFIVVVIQYRLGAFGFLASADVKSRGVVNAGLLDQAFALGWVQSFICLFGGDRDRVTIAGESAGASSVMYHALAAGGGLGTLFFSNGIAASPYLPFQYGFDAAFPTERYRAFAAKAGCAEAGDVVECLRGKDSMVLQRASANVTSEQTYGFWAFYPVTDGVYIESLASEQMGRKKVNGERFLVGNNANEGPLFVPPNIASVDDLTSWLKLEFSNLSSTQIDEILAANPTRTGANDTRFETNGLTGLTAMDVSQAGTGQLQRAINIYAESTFVCPSYWLSTAFTSPSTSAWHYQYSVPFAWHTSDIPAYFGPATPNQGADLTLAFRRIWGNFVTRSDPSIDDEVVNGALGGGASEWPAWTETGPKQLNLNQTGGVAYEFVTQWGVSVTQFAEPGLVTEIEVVPADEWEGGRGGRCEFWRRLAPSIPA